MKRALRYLMGAGVCAAALAVMLVSATPAKAADGATVTHQFFFFVISDPAFGGYSGSCTVVQTPSGNVNAECTGDLLFGDPVPEETYLTGGSLYLSGIGPAPCDAIVTSSGNAEVTCQVHK